jgi:DNA polymerase-3 subunit beta
MEFRIAADELKKALHRAQGIVERKTTMPILANVLVNAGKSGVSVTAFDLDIGIVSEHSAEVMKPGSVTLSAKTLFDIVSNLPEPQLIIKKLPNNHAEITCGSVSYRIVGMAR